MPRTLDQFARPLGSLRLSVTDRCNLRCRYCMPEDEYTWLPREDLLTFEELSRLAAIFARLGARKLRLTGGEPLLRRDLPDLVTRLATIPEADDLALTTNGVLLADSAADLRAAGLRRLTISLDTLRPDRFRTLTGRDDLPRVLTGIAAARAAGFERTKLNAVIIRGVNDDELVNLIDFGCGVDAEVRFIEYMDVGGATHWTPGGVFSRREMLERIADQLGPPTPLSDDPHAPAERFVLPDGTRFGIIASTTAPFCRACDRSRITADGVWYLCLYAPTGISLRDRLRQGVGDAELSAEIAGIWQTRTDRGAEDRLREIQRGPWVSLQQLRADRRLEMHTRGG